MEPIDTVEYMRTTPNSQYDQEFLCRVQKRGMQSCFFLFLLVLIELNSWGTSFLGLSPIVVFVKMIPVHRNENPGNLWSLFQCQIAIASPLHECFIRGFLCILILGLVSPSKSETQLCMCMYYVLYDTQEAKCQDNTTGDEGPHAL